MVDRPTHTLAESPRRANRGASRANPLRRPQAFVLHVLLLAGSALFLFPLVWMLSTALKPLDQTMLMPPRWIPGPAQWANFREAVSYIPFFTYARNTLTIALLGTLGTLVSSSLVAYGFSRIEWKGRDTVFIVLLATMMVPFPVTMVPLYAVFRYVHWIGTFRPLWVPAWFGASAFNVFLLRQFFLTIPRDFDDAARIDGCTEFGIFRRVVLPLSRPALAVVALFHFMYCWNDFLGPLIYLIDQDRFTLALGLQFFQSRQGGTPWNLLMAASTLVVAPIIVLFFFTQRTFIQGITMGGLKG
ncbi:MAG: carbohydrate ABC transporter permease [Candidatus Hydrogenedentales bacterium]|jgi:multiple sugar transport system permease protein